MIAQSKLDALDAKQFARLGLNATTRFNDVAWVTLKRQTSHRLRFDGLALWRTKQGNLILKLHSYRYNRDTLVSIADVAAVYRPVLSVDPTYPSEA